MEQGKPRTLPERDYLAIKGAFRQAVKTAGGPKLVAQTTRGTPSHICDWGSPDHMDRWPPADVLADVDAEASDPIVARTLADLAGYDIVARETKATGTDCEQFAGIAREAGEALEVFAKALDNGKVDSFEIPAIRKALHELLDKVHAVDAALDAKLKMRAVS
jgi:hypothetical protein